MSSSSCNTHVYNERHYTFDEVGKIIPSLVSDNGVDGVKRLLVDGRLIYNNQNLIDDISISALKWDRNIPNRMLVYILNMGVRKNNTSTINTVVSIINKLPYNRSIYYRYVCNVAAEYGNIEILKIFVIMYLECSPISILLVKKLYYKYENMSTMFEPDRSLIIEKLKNILTKYEGVQESIHSHDPMWNGIFKIPDYPIMMSDLYEEKQFYDELARSCAVGGSIPVLEYLDIISCGTIHYKSMLKIAAKHGHLELIKNILSKHSATDHLECENISLIAAAWGFEEIVDLILTLDTNTVSWIRMVALEASRAGHYPIVNKMLSRLEIDKSRMEAYNVSFNGIKVFLDMLRSCGEVKTRRPRPMLLEGCYSSPMIFDGGHNNEHMLLDVTSIPALDIAYTLLFEAVCTVLNSCG